MLSVIFLKNTFLLSKLKEPSISIFNALFLYLLLLIENFLNNLFLSLNLKRQIKFNLGYSSINTLCPLHSIMPSAIKISFEKLKIKENIKDGIRKEIININKIISEEIKNKDEIEETDDIDIEWDDNL